MDAPAADRRRRRAGDAGFGVVAGERGRRGAAAAEPAGAPTLTALQPVGQQIAIEAHADVQTDDVEAAVERITTTVTTRGGRVASADIDYAQPATDATTTTDVDRLAATLVSPSRRPSSAPCAACSRTSATCCPTTSSPRT